MGQTIEIFLYCNFRSINIDSVSFIRYTNITKNVPLPVPRRYEGWPNYEGKIFFSNHNFSPDKELRFKNTLFMYDGACAFLFLCPPCPRIYGKENMALEIWTAKYYPCSSLRTQYNPKFHIVTVMVKIAYTKTQRAQHFSRNWNNVNRLQKVSNGRILENLLYITW